MGRDAVEQCGMAADRRFNPRARAGRDLREGIPDPDKTFQSTRPRGRDLKFVDGALTAEVSIHAPARGATAICRRISRIFGFQSTRPRGARPPDIDSPCLHPRFNPRTRAGRDEAVHAPRV